METVQFIQSEITFSQYDVQALNLYLPDDALELYVHDFMHHCAAARDWMVEQLHE